MTKKHQKQVSQTMVKTKARKVAKKTAVKKSQKETIKHRLIEYIAGKPGCTSEFLDFVEETLR